MFIGVVLAIPAKRMLKLRIFYFFSSAVGAEWVLRRLMTSDKGSPMISGRMEFMVESKLDEQVF